MPTDLDAWTDVLCCPVDGSKLQAERDALVCMTCRQRCVYRGGILRCGGGADAVGADGEQEAEIQARDVEAEDYDRQFSALENALEIPLCLKALDPAADDVVAEFGCGTGRFTVRYAPRVRRIVALDFSLRSLEILRQRLPPELRERVLLVHADICAPPLRPHAFNKVVSVQVLQHLPTPQARQAAAAAACRVLRPGGAFTCVVYHWSRRQAVRGVPKEGFHDNSIYYFSFAESDLRGLLQDAGLAAEYVQGVDIGLPGMGWIGRLRVPVNRLLARTRCGIRNSRLLLARARAVGDAPPAECGTEQELEPARTR